MVAAGLSAVEEAFLVVTEGSAPGAGVTGGLGRRFPRTHSTQPVVERMPRESLTVVTIGSGLFLLEGPSRTREALDGQR